MATRHGGLRFPLKGRKSLPLASARGPGLARMAPHGSTRPDELVQGSDPRLYGGGTGYRFYPGGIGVGGGGYGLLHNALAGKQGGKDPDEFYHVPLLTQGAIPFADASGVLAQDVGNLFWDAGNKRLGIGTNAPVCTWHMAGTGYFRGYDLGALIIYRASSAAGAPLFALRSDAGGADTLQWRWDANGQALAPDGSAGAPSRSFLSYPTMGFWASAADRVNLEVGGLQVSDGVISTQGSAGAPAGTGPGAELRYVSGRASLLGYDRATPAYIPVELRGSALYFNLSGADKASITAGPKLWLQPYANPALTVDGQQAFNSANHASEHFMGGMKHYGGHWLHTGPSAADGDTGSGAHAETAFATKKTLPANYLTDGKGIRVFAVVHGQGGTAGANVILTFRIRVGGTSGLILASSTWSIQTTPHDYNVYLEGWLNVINPGSSGTVYAVGRATYVWDDAGLNGMKKVDTYGDHMLMFRDENGSTLNTTVSRDVVVTYQVEGTSGGWQVNLLAFDVERMG